MNKDCVCAYMTDLECSDDCAFTAYLYEYTVGILITAASAYIDCAVEPLYCGHPYDMT